MNLKLFNHILEARLSAKRPWSHFRVHKYDMHKHIVWGRLSVIVGQPHLEEMHVCSHCHEEIGRLRAGDDCLNYCEGCHQVEGDTEYITTEEYERIHG